MKLSEHDAETGAYTIYSKSDGAIVLTGDAEFHTFWKIERGIRAAERLAAETARMQFAIAIELAVREALASAGE